MSYDKNNSSSGMEHGILMNYSMNDNSNLPAIELKVSEEEFAKIDANLLPYERYTDIELLKKGYRNLVVESFFGRKFILVLDGK